MESAEHRLLNALRRHTALMALAGVVLAGLLPLHARADGACAPCAPCAGAAAPDAAADLPFASFFKQPAGPRGLEPTEALLRNTGCAVRLVGYMVQEEPPQPGRFRITAAPVRLSAHADGPADDLPAATVTVLLAAAQSARVVAYQPGPVAITGQLDYGRLEHADGRVSWLRLQLHPQALATESPASATAHSISLSSRQP